ncbi:MAG: helix-turn-helix transcriptional regulator [Lachnospiraceae bacterium]|nr:helix-turn-helix transcriptional regulator [Lachnospiraceae bacterium]
MTYRQPDPLNYNINSDFSGSRSVQSFQEFVEYHSEDAVRIWYNDQNMNYNSHWHTALEIIVPVENWYDVTIEDQNYHVLPGEILIIPSGALHSLRAPQSGARFIYLFDVSTIAALHGFSQIESIFTPPQCISKATHPQIYDDAYQLLMQMRDDYFSEKDFAELSIFSLLLNLFVVIGTNHMNNLNFLSSMRPSKQRAYTNKFHNVIEYIDTHYMYDLCLDDVAAAADFSKFHFSRLFKQYTGFTFCDYIRRRKIKAAEELLNQSDLTVTEVAMQSGFVSLSTFNRVFRQIKHCSPSEYREKNQHRLSRQAEIN